MQRKERHIARNVLEPLLVACAVETHVTTVEVLSNILEVLVEIVGALTLRSVQLAAFWHGSERTHMR